MLIEGPRMHVLALITSKTNKYCLFNNKNYFEDKNIQEKAGKRGIFPLKMGSKTRLLLHFLLSSTFSAVFYLATRFQGFVRTSTIISIGLRSTNTILDASIAPYLPWGTYGSL